MRLYDVQSGAVKLEGVDVRDLKQGSLRGSVAVVPQETVLFNDTCVLLPPLMQLSSLRQQKALPEDSTVQMHSLERLQSQIMTGTLIRSHVLFALLLPKMGHDVHTCFCYQYEFQA